MVRTWRSWVISLGSLGYSSWSAAGVMAQRHRGTDELERLGSAMSIVVAAFLGGLLLLGLPGSVVMGIVVAAVLVVRARSGARSRLEDVRRSIPEVVGLLGVAASAGLNPHRSIQTVSEIVDGPVAPLMAEAGSLARAGHTAAEALVAVAEKSGLDEFRSLARAFAASERQGSPLAPALRRMGRDLGERRRRRAEAAARKAPVRVLFPLVTCVLPAFVLLAVVPVVVDTFNVVKA